MSAWARATKLLDHSERVVLVKVDGLLQLLVHKDGEWYPLHAEEGDTLDDLLWPV